MLSLESLLIIAVIIDLLLIKVILISCRIDTFSWGKLLQEWILLKFHDFIEIKKQLNIYN